MTSSNKLTVRDIAELKGRRQILEVCVNSAEEASACEDAGIDIVTTVRQNQSVVHQAAPNTFLTVPIGIYDPNIVSERDAISEAFSAMADGADAIYTGLNIGIVAAMAREHIPVVGHVGYVPYRSTWYGGARAVGKAASEALDVCQATLEYEQAGAIAVEMEIVPHQVAAEVSKRVSLCVISMGSGNGCDAQYLFSEDILGTNRGHVPRHAKMYADLKSEFDRIQEMRVHAYAAFKKEVESGQYPAESHQLEIEDEEFERFMKGLE